MNNNDLRVKKTQRALMDSFLELLKTKNFSQITVQDLCDRAMVRRSTFYRHYSDKYDLLNQVLANFFNSLHESHLDNLLVKEPKTYFENIVRETLYFLIENRDTIQSVFTIAYYDEITRIVYNQLYKGVERQVNFDIRHGIRFNIDLEVYMEFMAGGILRIIYAWLKEGQKRSVEDLTREVVKIINGIRETHIKKF
ncbi:TetR/AcrR family transcriptional regulator [Staphylococcus caprae]|uniref:Transcriptional regulator, TetR family n=2 Tax=Staphylococcus TaxID=1279 RepID=A0ABN5W0U8_9STAP|nr:MULTISPECIES: TetR/AcrR family transcriptional regulator [Staphylococcus]EES41463.1 transcriptional regulator, TetR family [Staphylococcus caprae M23864:W1]MBN6826540.1 TetR/AcrR family transcriptional regulator [Staphylococcus caprae]MBU5272479.1 TetR/AcrR family transcriptional regulator [Staphylococcus caprae]MBX5317173.1 TetR/AcrR family transcriptional regulator [Staphylococcus caprae]MBX5323263.1 TetR/AcrR family transcriptional regulator [Staphylococcus caprae]